MPVKVKFGGGNHSLLVKIGQIALSAAIAVVAIVLIVFGYYSVKYHGEVDKRLAEGPLFASVAQVYAAPQEVRTGQQLSATTIANALHRAGYNVQQELGSYELRTGADSDSVLIKPGPQSYLAMDGATITTAKSSDGHPVVKSIVAENGAA